MKFFNLGILKRTALVYVSLCCLGMVVAAGVSAHPGSVNADGCHFLAKPRGEHCHKERVSRKAGSKIDHGSSRRAPEEASKRDRSSVTRLRQLYQYWIDADGDCQNTRAEVLIRESLEEPSLSEDGCTVIRGRWQDPYSGGIFTDARQVKVDHLVPVREVHVSGGSKWSRKKRAAYANDLSTPQALVVVYWREKKDKGSQSPVDWLPADKSYHCKYVWSWVRVKKKWKLTADIKERKVVGGILKACHKDR